MKTHRFSRWLKAAALSILLMGLAAWAIGGARLGWTQTSIVDMQRDEITGIDYPVRRAAFLPGIEVPLAGIAAAAVLAGLSRAAGRRPSTLQS